MTEHRIERIASHADRIIRMEAGRIVADGPATDDLVPHTEAAPARSGDTLASLSAITAGYPGRPVLKDAALALAAGTVTALAGENGSGKSTLARVLAGLHAPDHGSVQLEGEDVTAFPIERRFPRVAFVSQDPGRVLLRERVDDEVGFGPGQLGWPADERRRAVAAALEAVGLEQLAGRHPRDLSGGERERVAVAAALVSRPRVLVLDEPTRGMDDATSTRLVGLLQAHAEDGNASLVVTHDLSLSRRVAHRRLTLDRRRPVLTRALWPLLALVLGALALTLALDGRSAASVTLAALALVALGIAAWERGPGGAREVALVGSFGAAAAAGRVLFAAIPNVQPVTTMTACAGVALGPRAGAAVGGVAALISNGFLGQGPWTPWQMLAWGLVGATGGAAGPLLRRSRTALIVFCAVWGFVFDAILNVVDLATFGPSWTWQAFWALEGRGLPFDVAHATGNALLAAVAGPEPDPSTGSLREAHAGRARAGAHERRRPRPSTLRSTTRPTTPAAIGAARLAFCCTSALVSSIAVPISPTVPTRR